jgi:succinate dehydrogenase / fumarate reductase cytochrome b subunit
LATGKSPAVASIFNQELTMTARPLSPHLGIYRFGYTMALSIMHRLTGVAMALGLLVLTGWLVAAAHGADWYAATTSVLAHWFFKLLLGGWLFAFLFHLANGIRHLFWDAGMGFEKSAARRSAAIVVVVVLIVFAYCLYLLFGTRVAP